MKEFIKEFKEFATKSNVLDLAVAIVMGGALKGIIDSLVSGIINPIIARLFNVKNLELATTTILGIKFGTGLIIAAIINFIVIAFVLFIVIKSANKIKKSEVINESIEIELLTEIRDLMKEKG